MLNLLLEWLVQNSFNYVSKREKNIQLLKKKKKSFFPSLIYTLPVQIFAFKKQGVFVFDQ